MKFQGDILKFGDFIQDFVFPSYHHLNGYLMINKNQRLICMDIVQADLCLRCLHTSNGIIGNKLNIFGMRDILWGYLS